MEFYFEKTRFAVIVSIVAALLNVALNMLFIPIFGYRAAGYTTLSCYMLLGIAHYAYSQGLSRKLIGARPFNTQVVWGIAMAFVTVSLILPVLYPHPIVRYSAFGITVIAAFAFRKKIILKVKELKAR